MIKKFIERIRISNAKRTISAFTRSLPRPPEVREATYLINYIEKTTIFKTLGEYRIEIPVFIRADLVKVSIGDKEVIGFVDQYHQYSSMIGTNDWTYETEHLLRLAQLIKEGAV